MIAKQLLKSFGPWWRFLVVSEVYSTQMIRSSNPTDCWNNLLYEQTKRKRGRGGLILNKSAIALLNQTNLKPIQGSSKRYVLKSPIWGLPLSIQTTLCSNRYQEVAISGKEALDELVFEELR